MSSGNSSLAFNKASDVSGQNEIRLKPLFRPPWIKGNFPDSLFSPGLYIFWLIWYVMCCNNLTCIGRIHLFLACIFQRLSGRLPFHVLRLVSSYLMPYHTERVSGTRHTEIVNGYIWNGPQAISTLSAFTVRFSCSLECRIIA